MKLTEGQRNFFETYIAAIGQTQDPGGGASPRATDQRGTGQQGIVAKRRFLVERWKRIPAELRAETGNLKSEIVARVPSKDPDALGDGVQAWFDALVEEVRTELDDAIDTSINAGDQRYEAVTKLISTKLRPRVANDALVQVLNKVSLAKGTGFEDAFTKAFDEIEKALSE